jgi:hypothetical protein
MHARPPSKCCQTWEAYECVLHNRKPASLNTQQQAGRQRDIQAGGAWRSMRAQQPHAKGVGQLQHAHSTPACGCRKTTCHPERFYPFSAPSDHIRLPMSQSFPPDMLGRPIIPPAAAAAAAAPIPAMGPIPGRPAAAMQAQHTCERGLTVCCQQ